MTHEEAARISGPETSAKALREYGDGNAQIEACDEACRIAAEELRKTEVIPRTPLTLEQLENMEGQKVLLYRMKSTEPLELGTVKQRGDVLVDAGMLAYHELYLKTWVAFSCRAQEKPDFDKPLTLEQLRGMDGKPVWVEFEDGSGGLCGIVHISVFEQIVFPDGLHCTIGHPYYGKVYKAYAYPPARIDREAWTAECKHELKPLSYCCDDGYEFFTSRVENESGERLELKYCSKCGAVFAVEEEW